MSTKFIFCPLAVVRYRAGRLVVRRMSWMEGELCAATVLRSVVLPAPEGPHSAMIRLTGMFHSLAVCSLCVFGALRRALRDETYGPEHMPGSEGEVECVSFVGQHPEMALCLVRLACDR